MRPRAKHTVVNLQRVQYKERILKAVRGKKRSYKDDAINPSSDFRQQKGWEI